MEFLYPKVTITFIVPQGVKDHVRELVRAEVESCRKERDGGQWPVILAGLILPYI